MTLNREDATRLSDLRDFNELKELEILTSTPRSLADVIEDRDSLTVNQTMILSDFLKALQTIRTTARSIIDSEPPVFGGPVESRGGLGSSEYAADDSGTDDDPWSSGRAAWDAATPEERQDAINKVKAMFANAFGSSPASPDDPDTLFSTVNGPVRLGDIPRDPATGDLDASWIDENCPCDNHERQRAARESVTDAEVSGVSAYADSPGMYV